MISLCITTFNRFEFTVESFKELVHDNRISEIIISDDLSQDDSYLKLKKLFIGNDKVKLFQNKVNVGMSLNKAISVGYAENENCILFDSDNIISPSYIDAYFDNAIANPKTINVPQFAVPSFDFRKYAGMKIGIKECQDFMGYSMFRCFLNCCNYVVNKQEYLKIYEYDNTIKQADTIAFNYKWLKAGNDFYVVKGMEYYHRVHENSGFLENIDYNMAQAKEFENKIMQL